VEGAAERDVHGPVAELDALGPDERRDVAEADRADATADDVRPGLETAGRHVDDDAVLALVTLDDALVEGPRDERDRPVTACRRVARVVEEDDPEIRTSVVGLDDEAAVHVRVATGLEDEEPANVVEAGEGVAALVEDRRPGRSVDAAGHDPERLAARVV